MKTGIHIFLTIIGLIAASVYTKAENRGYIPDFELIAGQIVEISLYIQSPVESFDGFQTEIELPHELMYLQYEHGYAEYVDAYSSGFQVVSKLSDNTLKVVGFATDTNKKFNSGAVFKFKIRSSDNIEYNDYTITVKNTRVSKGENEYILDSTTEVTVVPAVAQSVILSASSLTMKVGDSCYLSAIIEPSNAVDQTVTWSSSDETVVTVVPVNESDHVSNVSAVSVGHATITATCGNLSASCEVTVIPTPASSITLNRNKATLKATQQVQLTATVLPETATDKTVTWSSSDEKVATVDGNGLVTAVAVGNATITATCGGVSANCEVTVEPTPVSSVRLNSSYAELEATEALQLTATVLPETATDKTVVWSSSDETVASVDGNGLVTAKAVGNAMITATCGNASASCYVNVLRTFAESVQLNQTVATLKVNETVQLSATVLPETTTDKTVTWFCFNRSVAHVDDNGLVTGISVGTATIMADCGNASAWCEVTVIPTPASSITLNQNTATLKATEHVQLTATVLPETTTDKTVTWSSSDESVAIVDETGLVTAIAVGNAEITASCGNVSTTCDVTVEPTPANYINLSQTERYLIAGESAQLTATVLPETTTDKTVTWSSSDESVAIVDETGLVTAIAVGNAETTATCGDVSATCHVTVWPTPASSVEISDTFVTLKTTETLQLTAVVLPETTTDKTVTWSSSNESVATVDESGLVTAIAVGSAVVTAKCGDATADCTVVVEPRYVTSITFDITEKVAKVGDEFTITATVLPENADNKTIEWYVSDNLIATVENGNVKVHHEGDCSIMAVANDGSGVKAECRLTAVSGIEDIVVTDKDARFDIYNLNGVLLRRNAGVEDLRGLTTGFYIVNSRKVYKH